MHTTDTQGAGPGGERGSASEADRTRETPGTDMQADDAGTASSGAGSGRGTAAEAAMKQTSKTASESGSGPDK